MRSYNANGRRKLVDAHILTIDEHGEKRDIVSLGLESGCDLWMWPLPCGVAIVSDIPTLTSLLSSRFIVIKKDFIFSELVRHRKNGATHFLFQLNKYLHIFA